MHAGPCKHQTGWLEQVLARSQEFSCLFDFTLLDAGLKLASSALQVHSCEEADSVLPHRAQHFMSAEETSQMPVATIALCSCFETSAS